MGVSIVYSSFKNVCIILKHGTDQVIYFHTLYAQKYEMSFKLYFGDELPRIAIFVSKMSHCLYDMLARYTAGEWSVEIPLIISNHPDLKHVADRFDIPYYVFPITKENKAEQEEKEMALLAENGITTIVLARYMQIISDRMIESYPNRIINIHHSFLPAFIGAKPYHQNRKSCGLRTRTIRKIW